MMPIALLADRVTRALWAWRGGAPHAPKRNPLPIVTQT
jgi:hypothetical protein